MHQKLNERVVDLNPQETSEWVEALDQVIDEAGPDRAAYLLEQLTERARVNGAELPIHLNTPYVNTIRPEDEVPYPGDRAMERRIKSLIRWNAMAMVVRQNKYDPGIGGHISTYASLATLLEVGFNHFFHAKYGDQPGDLIYFQGHASPGVYARAFLEGRLTEEHLKNFRHELRDTPGLSSYPHPWLMPDFWTLPHGFHGPRAASTRSTRRASCATWKIAACIPATPRKIWAFLGDGEMDEPESMGSLTLASREKLDNLIFVINCNLQRLDGPVRGNGKMIQELEAAFRGAGWNVIKVIWGERLGRTAGAATPPACCKSAWAKWWTASSRPTSPRTAPTSARTSSANIPSCCDLVSHLSDDELLRLHRGGHDPRKVYNAYKAAVETKGQPTADSGAHHQGLRTGRSRRRPQHHPPAEEAERSRRSLHFRSRFEIPIPEEAARNASFYRPPADSPEIAYLHERRRQLGGYMPSRSAAAGEHSGAAARILEGIAGRLGRARSFQHHGVRPRADHADEAPGDRQAHRADHSR